MTSNALAGRVALVATGIAFLSLTILHVLSPEFQPSWRMVSEYANGRHGWLLSMMFAAWGVGSLALASALGPYASGTLGRVGVAFLVLAGVGEIMAAVFDINHRLHGLAAMIGIPSLPIAAVLITKARRRADRAGAPPAWAAHLTWISFVLMGVAMAIFMRSLSQAGVDVSAQTGPLSALPAGVTSFVGWANRLLVLAYLTWVGLAALPLVRRTSASSA
jgi:hypothetical membrane protein